MEILQTFQPYGIYLIAVGGILVALGFIIGFFEKPAVVAAPTQGLTPPRPMDDDPVARLERGLITDADYESLKAKALQRNE
jgi:hypothetical protein